MTSSLLEEVVLNKSIKTLYKFYDNWYFDEEDLLKSITNAINEYNNNLKEELQKIALSDDSVEEILKKTKILLQNFDYNYPIILRYDYIGEYLNERDVFVKQKLIYKDDSFELKKLQLLAKGSGDIFTVKICPDVYGNYNWQESYIFGKYLEIDEVYNKFYECGVEFLDDDESLYEEFSGFVMNKNNR